MVVRRISDAAAEKRETHAEQQSVVEVVEELIERGAKLVFCRGLGRGDVRVVGREEGRREATEYAGDREAGVR